MHIVITGSSKGIGLEAARLFSKAGHRITGIARHYSEDPLFALPGNRQIAFDLEDIEAIPSLAAQAGPADVLVNNAGLMLGIGPEAYTSQMREQVMRLNLEAPVALIEAFAPGMVERKKGRIVNNASIAGQIGHPDVWYGISKAGLLNATKSFALLLGTHGIQVNAVAPSPVETDMLDKIPLARREKFLASTSERRFASALEIAQALFWLGTEAPAYMNGACLDLNSGSYLR